MRPGSAPAQATGRAAQITNDRPRAMTQSGPAVASAPHPQQTELEIGKCKTVERQIADILLLERRSVAAFKLNKTLCPALESGHRNCKA